MKTKAKQAIIFGLVFSILLTGISFIGPEIVRYECGGQKESTIKVLGAELFTRGSVDSECNSGEIKTTVGFPFPTRVQEGEVIQQRVIERDRSQFETQTNGIFSNYVAYTLAAFVIFFLFAPRRKDRVN